MADRAYLKPTSVREPAQGDFQYLPVVKIFEADTAAALEDLIALDFAVLQLSTTEYWVIEDIKYQVAMIKLETGNNDHMALYSALVHATKVEII